MKKADADDHVRLSENFQSHLRSLADEQAREGQDVPAGLLLLLARRVYIVTTEWRVSIQVDDAQPAPAAVVEIEKRHRHDFTESVAMGQNPPRCKCGHVKNPNGRPRTQQVIAPAKGPVFP